MNRLMSTAKTIGKAILVLLLFLSIGVSESFATHVVGGELKYRSLGNERYEITLTFRRDCFNGADDAQFDNPANVWIFNGDGNLQTKLGANGRLKMNFNSSDTLNEFIRSDCGFEGTQVCVHETTYREIVRLPYVPETNGYILSYVRCCRNQTLGNVLEPLETGGTWTVNILPDAELEGNTSPDFNEWAPIYVCANEDVDFDHSAIDADGDSLVYKLCTPFLGGTSDDPVPTQTPFPPFTPVAWAEGFSINNLLGGEPLQIDSETGLLTGIPNFVGQFLVGVCVEEYRDGVKIGEVRRDFQYNVRLCSDPPTAIFEANEGNCDGPDVVFDNLSLGANVFQWDFDFPSTDPAFLSTEENPEFTYPAPGVYDVRLIVRRGTDACSDTIVQQVAAIFSDIVVDYDLEIQACNDDGGYAIRLINRSMEPEEGFEIIGADWTISQNGEVTNLSGNVVNLIIGPSDFELDLQVESTTGCKKSLTDTVMISDFEHVADFEFELVSCPEFGTATIAFGDVSDALNPFDTPVSYSWTVDLDGVETTFNDSSFTYDVLDTETLTVSLEVDFGGGCTATVSKEIVVQDIVPQASYDLIPEGCPDDGTVDLTFVSTSMEGNPEYTVASTEWSISVAGQTFTSMDTFIMINAPKDSVVTVDLTVTFTNGCGDNITESYVPGPFANIAFDASPFVLCLGDTLPFVTSPNEDFTYSWAPTEGLVFDAPYSMANPGMIGISDTEYAVTVSDGLCELTSSLMVTVLDAGNLMIAGDSITCDGTVSLTASGGIGAGVFEWSLTTDFATVIHIGEVYTTSFDGQSETYYVRFTGESCGDPFAEYTVILSDIYDVMFDGDPVRVCLGDTVPLLANPNPLLTYEWSPLSGLFFADPTDGSTAQVIGIENTTYQVVISDDFCSLDTFVNVVIGDAQDFQILGDSIVCTDTVQLIAAGASGIGEYEWSLTEDFSDIIHVGDTLSTILATNPTVYYVQFTDKTCGDLILSYSVRRYDFDLLFAEPYMICAGDTLAYNVFNQGESPLIWEWEEDPHVVADGNTNMPIVGVGPDETDDFDLVFTVTSPSGCMLTDTVSFQIMDNPVIDFDFELTDCGELTVCFTIDSVYNGFPSWDFGDPTTTMDVSIEEAPCYTYSVPGVYDVTLDNLTSLCPFDPVTKTVTVNGDITIDPIDDQIICLGDSVMLTATSPNLNISYVWCTLTGDTLQLGPDYSEVVNDDFDLVIKASDPNGCFDMDTIAVSPFLFDITHNVPTVFCTDEATDIELFVNGTQNGYTFEWGPEECVISGGNTGSPILQAAGEKEFVVTITNIDLGCVFMDTFDISTTSFTVELDAIDENGINTDTINQEDEITIFVIDADDGYMYEWSDGSTDDELTVSPEMTTTYSVTITDEMGCTATDDITIIVRLPQCDETDVFLPSAFTPNNDGTNDVLFLRSNFIDEMELLIYNRWGEEVFYTDNQSVGWDGTYQGQTLAPDAYAYTLRVICINQAEYTVRGNVSLMK